MLCYPITWLPFFSFIRIPSMSYNMHKKCHFAKFALFYAFIVHRNLRAYSHVAALLACHAIIIASHKQYFYSNTKIFVVKRSSPLPLPATATSTPLLPTLHHPVARWPFGGTHFTIMTPFFHPRERDFVKWSTDFISK